MRPCWPRRARHLLGTARALNFRHGYFDQSAEVWGDDGQLGQHAPDGLLPRLKRALPVAEDVEVQPSG